MNRCWMIVFVGAFAAFSVQAQNNPLSTEAQQAWTRTINNVVAAAEKMPAENYSFKPAPESQSFGELVAHTANSAMGACSGLSGERKQAGAEPAGSKDSLTAALKAAMAECEKAYGSVTDANATEMIEGRRGSRSRLGTLWGNTVHIEHEYAQMAVHLRLKGVVPPSSERR
jgi:hypothetical protein